MQPQSSGAAQRDAAKDGVLGTLISAARYEYARGFRGAMQVTARIYLAIPHDVAEYIRLAYAIEAIEDRDHASWPSTWLISDFLPDFLNQFANLSSLNTVDHFQRMRYDELYRFNPSLLAKVEQGLTRKLCISHRDAFIAELIRAGRRKCTVADEAGATNEDRVLHVALSYKHVPWSVDRDGTIDLQTAEEAYHVIRSIPFVTDNTQVRVWVDQNLHRYAQEGPWYEASFHMC